MRIHHLCRDIRRFLVAAIAISLFSIDQTAHALPGDPMPTFGTSGQVKAFVQNLSSSGKAMKIDRFGRIVLAGECLQAGFSRPCVARFLADGAPDNSFRGGTTPGVALFTEVGSVETLLLQADGSIMLGGTCDGLFCLLRLADDGTLLRKSDIDYISNSPYRYFSALAQQTDQRIVAAGNCQRNGAPTGCVLRFSADGELDLTYLVRTHTLNSTGVFLRAVALQSNGQIIIGASCERFGRYSFCIARLNYNGALDTEFGGGGVVYVDLGSGSSEVAALAVLPDDRVVAVGRCQQGAVSRVCAVRLLPEGEPDPAFGTDGIAIVATAESPIANALAVAEDGALYVGATCNLNQCVFKLKSDGKRLDEGFGIAGGVVRATATLGDQGRAISLTRGGDVLLGGTCNSSNKNAFCVLQLEGGPRGARACSLDVDGDGRILPLTDGLILSRLSRGMRGASVLQGVQLDSAAMRTTYENIRDFLFFHCGMQF
jgi:uncharacterized delta-60 repeat protein